MTLAPAFKDARIRSEWDSMLLHPYARIITLELCILGMQRGWFPLLTCIYRTYKEDVELGGSGLHLAWRAVDVRTHDQDPAVVSEVCGVLNRRWVYDPDRPALNVALNRPHGTGPHVHIQAHPYTVLRASA